MDSDLEFPLVAVGEWYRTIDADSLEVVAADESEDSIEVQYFDGTVAEFDTESWHETIIGSGSPPEDWTGSLDIRRDDDGMDTGDSSSDGYLQARRYLDGV